MRLITSRTVYTMTYAMNVIAVVVMVSSLVPAVSGGVGMITFRLHVMLSEHS